MPSASIRSWPVSRRGGAVNVSSGPLVGQLLAAVEEAQGAGEVRSREEGLALARREFERRSGAEARSG